MSIILTREQVEEIKKAEKIRLHKARTELDPVVYDHLRKKYGSFLKDYWNSIEIPIHAPNTVLLVERRKHPNMEFVLHNHMYFANKSGESFSLTIVCSDFNEEYVRECLGKHQETAIILPIFHGEGSREQGVADYNRLFTDKKFWEGFEAEYILSIQTDSYLRNPLPDILWDYEYVACKWGWKQELVGGGGLTWRKKSALVRLCQRDNKNGTIPEDVYFSEGCKELNIHIPSYSIGIQMFSESILVSNPIGVHQWWTYYNELLFYTPEEERIKQNTDSIFIDYMTLNL